MIRIPSARIAVTLACAATATGLLARAEQSRPAPEFAPPSIVDYRPRTALVAPAHPVPRAASPVIDVHSHHTLPLSESYLARLAAEMDSVNLRLVVNLSGGSGTALTDAIAAARRGPMKDRMVFFANIDFRNVGPGFGERAARKLETDIAAGALGLKVFKSLGLRIRKLDGSRLRLDDPELDPIWAACARLGVPVAIHAGEPAPFFEPIDTANERWLELALFADRRYQGSEFPRFEEVIAERNRLFARHPSTIFIALHMAYHANDLARLGRLLEQFPNVHVETAAVLAELGRQPRAARRFFERYQDRVMFGKDTYAPEEYPYYWRTFETADEYFDYYRDYHAFWKLYGMELPPAILQKVYSGNAMRIVRGLPAGAPAAARR
jgi:predicted TIM-barrel fold metal-dependent hydrolase